jgi:hypothetical protein
LTGRRRETHVPSCLDNVRGVTVSIFFSSIVPAKHYFGRRRGLLPFPFPAADMRTLPLAVILSLTRRGRRPRVPVCPASERDVRVVVSLLVRYPSQYLPATERIVNIDTFRVCKRAGSALLAHPPLVKTAHPLPLTRHSPRKTEVQANNPLQSHSMRSNSMQLSRLRLSPKE